MSPPPVVAEERTALAWQRTGFGVMAIAGLIASRALVSGRPVLLAVAGGTALLSLTVLGGLAPGRYHRIRRALADGAPVAAGGSAAAVTSIVVAAALAALAAVVWPR